MPLVPYGVWLFFFLSFSHIVHSSSLFFISQYALLRLSFLFP